MSSQPVDLFVFTHAHWLYWAFTALVIVGAMALTVSVGRPKHESKPVRWP